LVEKLSLQRCIENVHVRELGLKKSLVVDQNFLRLARHEMNVAFKWNFKDKIYQVDFNITVFFSLLKSIEIFSTSGMFILYYKLNRIEHKTSYIIT